MKATATLFISLAVFPIASCHAEEAPKPEEAKPAVIKTEEAKPAPEGKAPDPASKPAPEGGEVARLKLGVLPGMLKFDTAVLTVKPGQKVKLLFQNARDAQPHNFLLVKPGKLNAVGTLAEKMTVSDPAQAMKKNYIPESPDILAHGTKLITLGQNDLIEFSAPAEPGDYPYLCTYPGHFRLMNGVLKVAP